MPGSFKKIFKYGEEWGQKPPEQLYNHKTAGGCDRDSLSVTL